MSAKPLTIALLSLLGLVACHEGEEELRDADTVPIGAWTFEGADASQGAVYFHKNDFVMDDEDLHVFGSHGAYRWAPVEHLRVEISFADAPVAQVEIEPTEDWPGADGAYFRWNDGADEVLLRRVESCILACGE